MVWRRNVVSVLIALFALGGLACEVEEDAGEELVPDNDEEEVDDPEEEET